jgi:hypothetical protein
MILEEALVLMQKGTPVHTMIMEGAQILCLNLGTVPTMVVLKVPCMSNIAGWKTFIYQLKFLLFYPAFLHLFDMFVVLNVLICDFAARASHPLQKNDFSC